MTSIREVGRVGRPIGIKGELLIHPISDHPDRFVAGGCLIIGGTELTISSVRTYKDKLAIRFAGVTSREKAGCLTNETIFGQRLDAPEGVWLIDELIGKPVVDENGSAIGTVKAIEPNPASDLLVLEGDELIPLTFVLDVGEVVLVDIPEGLI